MEFQFRFSVETPNASILGHVQVQTRFGDEHLIHLESESGSGTYIFSMKELYVHLFQGLEQWPREEAREQECSGSGAVEHEADREQWRHKNTVLHSALHEKLSSANECSVCASCRLRQDTRRLRADWGDKAVGLLWYLTVSTIREHGTGWQVWRPKRVVRASARRLFFSLPKCVHR